MVTQQPPGYEQAERLANWTRPELSCDDFTENTAAPGSTPPAHVSPSWYSRQLNNQSKAPTAVNMEEVPLKKRLGASSPKSQGTHGSGSLRWANVVRQIQKKK